jgi:hypothetical protein
MITSLRWPLSTVPDPNSFASWPVSTNARESDPTSRMLNGAPGFDDSFVRCLTGTFVIWSKRKRA